MGDNWVKNILAKIDESIKKHKLKPIFEVIALIVAIIVMINMWCTYGIMKDSVDKMREQNRLSQESLIRTDSTISLMSEANKLTKNSLILAESSFALGRKELKENIKQGKLKEEEFIEKNQPKLVIMPLGVKDIMKDSTENLNIIHCTVNNQGQGDARNVAVRIFAVASGKKVTFASHTFSIIQGISSARESGKVVPLDLPGNVGAFAILIEVDYDWQLPNGEIKKFTGLHKAFGALWDKDKNEYKTIKSMDEDQIKRAITPILGTE
jgi:hypothetical protein